MRTPAISSDVDGGTGVDEETHHAGLGRIGVARDEHPGGREAPMKQRHPLAVTPEPQSFPTRRDHKRAALKREHEGAALGLEAARREYPLVLLSDCRHEDRDAAAWGRHIVRGRRRRSTRRLLGGAAAAGALPPPAACCVAGAWTMPRGVGVRTPGGRACSWPGSPPPPGGSGAPRQFMRAGTGRRAPPWPPPLPSLREAQVGGPSGSYSVGPQATPRDAAPPACGLPPRPA